MELNQNNLSIRSFSDDVSAHKQSTKRSHSVLNYIARTPFLGTGYLFYLTARVHWGEKENSFRAFNYPSPVIGMCCFSKIACIKSVPQQMTSLLT